MDSSPDMAFDGDFAIRLLSIALINIALSGDNVIVIGMAAASLPREQRRVAVLGGGLLAIALRVSLTLIAAELLKIPLISVVGGLVLFWVAWGLLKADAAQPDRLTPAPENLRRAVQLIVLADVTMSLDNVVAVAGSARGDALLLAVGLIISMPLLMVSGGAVSILIDRFRWLIYIGAAAICFTGARMILDSPPVLASLGLVDSVVVVVCLALSVAVPVAFFIGRGRKHVR